MSDEDRSSRRSSYSEEETPGGVDLDQEYGTGSVRPPPRHLVAMLSDVQSFGVVNMMGDELPVPESDSEDGEELEVDDELPPVPDDTLPVPDSASEDSMDDTPSTPVPSSTPVPVQGKKKAVAGQPQQMISGIVPVMVVASPEAMKQMAMQQSMALSQQQSQLQAGQGMVVNVELQQQNEKKEAENESEEEESSDESSGLPSEVSEDDEAPKRKKKKKPKVDKKELEWSGDLDGLEDEEEEEEEDKKPLIKMPKFKKPPKQNKFFEDSRNTFWSSTRRKIKWRKRKGTKVKTPTREKYPIRCWKACHFFWPAAFCFVFLAVLIPTLPFFVSLPESKPTGVLATKFSEDRALVSRDELVAFGPRDLGAMFFNTTGSTSTAFTWLENEVKTRLNNSVIPSSYEKVTVPAFSLGDDSIFQDISYVSSLQSLLVHIRGEYSDSVLVGINIDSPSTSTLASSAGLIAMALEMIDNILADEQLEHSILFAFTPRGSLGNSGARSILSHRWIRDVRTFVTLSTDFGTDGKLRIIRSTELNSNILGAYRASFSGIHATSMFEDFLYYFPNQQFRDFSVYEEISGTQGCELGFVDGAQRVLSAADNSDEFSDGTLQYAGEGMLKMVKNSAVAKKGGFAVLYFDVLSIMMMCIPNYIIRIASIVLYIFMAFSLCFVPFLFNMFRNPVKTFAYRHLPSVPIVILYFAALLFSFVLGYLLVFLVGFLRPSALYQNPWVGVFLFGSAPVGLVTFALSWYHTEQLRLRRHPRYTEMFGLWTAIVLIASFAVVFAILDLTGAASFKSLYIVFFWAFFPGYAAIVALGIDRQLMVCWRSFRGKKTFGHCVAWDIWSFPRALISIVPPTFVTVAALYSMYQFLPSFALHYKLNSSVIHFMPVMIMGIPTILLMWMMSMTIFNFVTGRGHYFCLVLGVFLSGFVFVVVTMAMSEYSEEKPQPVYVTQVRVRDVNLGDADATSDSRIIISSPVRILSYSSMLADAEDSQGQKGFACDNSGDFNLLTGKFDAANWCYGISIPEPVSNFTQCINYLGSTLINGGTQRLFSFEQSSLCDAESYTFQIQHSPRAWDIGGQIFRAHENTDVKSFNQFTHVVGAPGDTLTWNVTMDAITEIEVVMQLNFDIRTTEYNNVINALPKWASPYALPMGYSPYIFMVGRTWSA